ncbi:MAG: bifunctional hydroxymethylpyrimidine kinase/phosphomethylpyrimidine kinase [Chloroflexi bacterium]|nr:bifunctional hydroxymethylpyrimidine kinase/phosphomethylpyrimidine kinase [Chloroflexota bacterium]
MVLDPKVGRVRVVLTIAGSDSGGGAGIQADLKTFAAMGVHGATAVTALTAQDTRGIIAVQEVTPEFVAQQIDVVVADLTVDATKTGMLGNAAVVETVVAKVAEHGLRPLVVDTVLAATSGERLLAPEGLTKLRAHLIPLATVVTPNLSEAEALTGSPVQSLEDMREAAREIHALGAQAVVVKGGHLPQSAEAVDVLFDGAEFVELRRPWIRTSNLHGTGCTFASALAGGLALGLAVGPAAELAKELVTQAIKRGLSLGQGRGPVNPVAILYERAGRLDPI